MPDGTVAKRDEIDRAIEALTIGDLLRLRRFADYRMRGLGRAACGRTCDDLLQEAGLLTLEGAANNGRGRRWNQDVDLVTHLIGTMRSISSHWKRDFDNEEADLESDISKRIEEGRPTFPLDNVASYAPSQQRELAARQQWNLIMTRCHDDPVASRVLEGFSKGLTTAGIMGNYGLTRSEYQKAMTRIRRRIRDIDPLQDRQDSRMKV